MNAVTVIQPEKDTLIGVHPGETVILIIPLGSRGVEADEETSADS